MSALALRTGAINLGQGFPDTDGPPSLLADAAANIPAGINQYPPGIGVPELRAAVAEHQRRFYGLDVDPDAVLVTTGATEAIAVGGAGAVRAGRRGRDVPAVLRLLRGHDRAGRRGAAPGAAAAAATFAFDPDELRAAFSARTRLVLVNTPHNPTGAVFDREQLTLIGELAAEHDAVVVTDEVYEHMVFDGRPHVPMATLPGMAERTLTISSAGKTFSVTGWKVGWVHGPGELVAAVRAAKQFLTYVSGAPFQPAIAAALGLPDSFYTDLAADLQRKRDLLSGGLRAAGLHRVPTGRHLLRRHRRRRRSASPTAPSSAGACPSGSGWPRCRCRCSAPTPSWAARWSGSRSASATRCWPRRRPGWSHCAPRRADAWATGPGAPRSVDQQFGAFSCQIRPFSRRTADHGRERGGSAQCAASPKALHARARRTGGCTATMGRASAVRPR